MGTIHYPFPSHQKGHPELSPTSEGLPDSEVMRLLAKYTETQRKNRLVMSGALPRRSWGGFVKPKGPSLREREERVMTMLNQMIADLTQEAIKRGLLNPDEGIGRPE